MREGKDGYFWIFEKYAAKTKNENIFGFANTSGKVLMNFLDF